MPRGRTPSRRSSSGRRTAAGIATPTPTATPASRRPPTCCAGSASAQPTSWASWTGTASATSSSTGRSRTWMPHMLQMNLRLSAEDLGYVTAHSDASWVLVDESLLPVAEALAPHAPNVKGWIVMTDKPLPEIFTTLPGVHHFETLLAAADAEIDWPVIDETSAYSACYTTGTTGRPKGIFYSHRGIYLHTLTMVADLGMRSRDAVMLVTPMFHGQCWGLPQAAVRAAAKVVLPGRYMA